jgi:hypothetical protein
MYAWGTAEPKLLSAMGSECLDRPVTDRDLEVVVRHYRANHQAVPMRELDYFDTRETDEDAVAEAAMCRMGGKRLSHQ